MKDLVHHLKSGVALAKTHPISPVTSKAYNFIANENEVLLTYFSPQKNQRLALYLNYYK